MGAGNGLDDGQAKPRAATGARAGIIGPPEPLEGAMPGPGRQARAVVGAPDHHAVPCPARLDRQRAAGGVTPGIVEDREQRLPYPRPIGDDDGASEVVFDGKAGFRQVLLDGGRDALDLNGEIDLVQLELQPAGIRQAEGSEILDDTREIVDMRYQPAVKLGARREHPVGKPLQATSQNGQRRAQFMGDGRIRVFQLRFRVLEAHRHRVEVGDEAFRLAIHRPDRLGPRGEIAVRD